MTSATKAYWILTGLFVLSLLIHAQFLGGSLGSLSIEDEFTYEQTVELTGSLGSINLKMYVPTPGVGLEIRDERIETADLNLVIEETDGGRLILLKGNTENQKRHIRYGAKIKSLPLVYTLNESLGWEIPAEADSLWLSSTSSIQTGNAEISRQLAKLFELDIEKADDASFLNWNHQQWQEILEIRGVGPTQVLRVIYDYALEGIQPASFSGKTDALTALRLNESSCGGKSRLMVAMCRTLGIPARVVGGVIMNQGQRKRTHHLWVETRLGEAWVPFDPLNDYFAMKPARFLTLYKGDLPLIRHSRGLSIDYGFSSVKKMVPLIWKGDQSGVDVEGESTFARSSSLVPMLNRYNYSAIMLAPFCLLFIVFVRQVLGVVTIGTFLPILLGFSLVHGNWVVTLAQMIVALLLGVLLRFILTRLSLLHVPRTAVMITFVVLVFLAFSAGMSRFDSLAGMGTVILPLAALAMAVEKFTLVAMDKGSISALGLVAQTFLVAAFCRLIMITPFFQNLTIAFPEVLLLIIAMIILVGNYRGLRLKELWRFRQVRKVAAQ
jgi:hypothetical protein